MMNYAIIGHRVISGRDKPPLLLAFPRNFYRNMNPKEKGIFRRVTGINYLENLENLKSDESLEEWKKISTKAALKYSETLLDLAQNRDESALNNYRKYLRLLRLLSSLFADLMEKIPQQYDVKIPPFFSTSVERERWRLSVKPFILAPHEEIFLSNRWDDQAIETSILSEMFILAFPYFQQEDPFSYKVLHAVVNNVIGASDVLNTARLLLFKYLYDRYIADRNADQNRLDMGVSIKGLREEGLYYDIVVKAIMQRIGWSIEYGMDIDNSADLESYIKSTVGKIKWKCLKAEMVEEKRERSLLFVVEKFEEIIEDLRRFFESIEQTTGRSWKARIVVALMLEKENIKRLDPLEKAFLEFKKMLKEY